MLALGGVIASWLSDEPASLAGREWLPSNFGLDFHHLFQLVENARDKFDAESDGFAVVSSGIEALLGFGDALKALGVSGLDLESVLFFHLRHASQPRNTS